MTCRLGGERSIQMQLPDRSDTFSRCQQIPLFRPKVKLQFERKKLYPDSLREWVSERKPGPLMLYLHFDLYDEK